MTSCAKCGTNNDDGSAFCTACGASLAAQIHCPNCNSLEKLGRAFCSRCGGSLEHAGWGEPVDPGAVVDGEWQRGRDELIRRVDPEEARRFLGTRTVRVPAGTVGVVLVDGVVDRVLPPGERTSVSLFQRVASFFAGRERTAFYLVDQRPFPVPFVVRTRPSATGEQIKSQLMVTFLLPKGDRDALAMFIDTVLRERTSVSTGELYNEVRPEVARIAQEVLERTGDDYPAAEAEIRRRLADDLGRRYGLTVDATLAPVTAIASVTLALGAAAAPKLRACVKCRAELAQSMKFCDKCGAQQPTVPVDGPGDALFTSDGQQVELDLVVRVSGRHDDFSPGKITPAIAAAAAAHLRGVAFAQVAAPGGFAALEAAMAPAVTQALQAFGMQLVAVSVVDARTKTGQWLLAARADLERAAEDTRLALSWLEQRDTELDVEQLAITRALRAQQIRRDQRFAEDDAQVGDRERRDALGARDAVLDVAKIQRDDTVNAARDDAARAHARRNVEQMNEIKRAQFDAELAMKAATDTQQIDKLRAMAQLDREIAHDDHARELEKRAQLAGRSPDEMIAMQAAELAKADGGGAAWVNALAARADQERRHADDNRAVYKDAMAAMADVARSRAPRARPSSSRPSSPRARAATARSSPTRSSAAPAERRSDRLGPRPRLRRRGQRHDRRLARAPARRAAARDSLQRRPAGGAPRRARRRPRALLRAARQRELRRRRAHAPRARHGRRSVRAPRRDRRAPPAGHADRRSALRPRHAVARDRQPRARGAARPRTPRLDRPRRRRGQARSRAARRGRARRRLRRRHAHDARSPARPRRRGDRPGARRAGVPEADREVGAEHAWAASLRTADELVARGREPDLFDAYLDAARRPLALAALPPPAGHVILESAQGALLDRDHGFFPHVTPSRITRRAAEDAARALGLAGPLATWGVLRAYHTRHGEGPFPSDDAGLAARLPELHNREDGPAGRFRVGWFDAVLARHAIAFAGPIDHLAVTCLDRAAALPERAVVDAWDREQLDTAGAFAAVPHVRRVDALAPAIAELLGRRIDVESHGPRARDKSTT